VQFAAARALILNSHRQIEAPFALCALATRVQINRYDKKATTIDLPETGCAGYTTIRVVKSIRAVPSALRTQFGGADNAFII